MRLLIDALTTMLSCWRRQHLSCIRR